MIRRLAVVVGVGCIERDLSSVVDNADLVMHFNQPNLSGGMSCTRMDLLMLAVCPVNGKETGFSSFVSVK